MKTSITFEVDADNLPSFSDTHIAQLWHVSQANPAPFGDAAACDFAERVGREIVRRWLNDKPPELWAHQGRHVGGHGRASAAPGPKQI
jgi:hypothetical protein